jgi:mRNA-degrading endonuclease toxin of MazEF toxin-antitoxin module
VPTPQRGRIILARALDPQGGNPKIRPFVIVTDTEEIQQGIPFVGVAITGSFAKPPPPDCVQLPHRPDGHPQTKLNKEAVAMCSWARQIQHEDIVDYKGMVPARLMEQILAIVHRLDSEQRGAASEGA